MPHTEQTALVNGRIHTPMGMAEALLIEAGRIAAIGTTATSGLHCDTRLIDLGGRSLRRQSVWGPAVPWTIFAEPLKPTRPSIPPPLADGIRGTAGITS